MASHPAVETAGYAGTKSACADSTPDARAETPGRPPRTHVATCRCNPRLLTLLLLGALLALLPCAPAPAQKPAFGLTVFTTRRELSGLIRGGSKWTAFCIDEDETDLNRDGDVEDTILCFLDGGTMAIQLTGVAIDPTLSDSDEDPYVAFSGPQIVVQASEGDNGKKDLNGNGRAAENVLELYDPATRQFTSLGVSGRYPTFLGEKLYFVQDEAVARRDLNGDGDVQDAVLSAYDLSSRKVESLDMEANAGFEAAGDWIATRTSEHGQGGKDLNGDMDTQDEVAQVYQVSQKKWTSTSLECSTGIALTPSLLAVATDEVKQGNKDLNGDQDASDVVCHVWDLAGAKAINTRQECSGGIAADGIVAAFAAKESSQGSDLNSDGDMQDVIVEAYVLGATAPLRNLQRDASGGLAAANGKVAFVCAESSQKQTDLNRDRDTDDVVLMVYDPVKNQVVNSNYAVDGDISAGEGYLAWKVAEADQGNRDMNRDGDVEDSVLVVMNLATSAVAVTSTAAGDSMAVTARGVGFSTFEADQGEKDLNGDGDTDDEIVQFAQCR